MSENIESNMQHRVRNLKQAGIQSVKGNKEEVSNIARNGQKFERQDSDMVTACSNFAVIREKIQLTQDNRHVQLFKSRYDQLFAEFHEKLFAEYKGVKESYVQEYQDNYQMNLNEKQANIDEFI